MPDFRTGTQGAQSVRRPIVISQNQDPLPLASIRKTQVLRAEVSFTPRELARPLRLSSGDITELIETEATVWVAMGNRTAIGKGSIFLSHLWAWPEGPLDHTEKLNRMRRLCLTLADDLSDVTGPEAHPLELGLRLHRRVAEDHYADSESAVSSILARSLCASPFDAAIHDGAGRLTSRSALDWYDLACDIPSGDTFFGAPGRLVDAIRATLIPARTELPGWYIAGPDTKSDEIEAAVRDRGFTRFKLKLTGRDLRLDLAQTAAVHRIAHTAIDGQTREVHLVLDPNEAHPDSEATLELLCRLEEESPAAYRAIDYLEQPTHRDIVARPNDWTEVARRKPVMADEGLTDFEVFDELHTQRWSGFALKSCKGHSFVLAAAAWAYERGMRLSMQDLTNPGYSAIHGAILAARLPTINGVELNSSQFTPEANRRWLPRLELLFSPRNGIHRLPPPDTPGLGSLL